MKTRNQVLLGLILIVLAFCGYAVHKHFENIVPRERGEYGDFYVDGIVNGELGVKLRSSNGSSNMNGHGKRIESLNETLNELKYVDPDGRSWVVPKGTVNDGASVPPLLESIVPGGLNTDARYAAILHDCYCDLMKVEGKNPEGGYPAVHRMFYYAMLCSKVEKKTAATMYVAVVKFGPPSDRSLWTKIVANGSPDDFKKTYLDSKHAMSKWVGGMKLNEAEGKVVLWDEAKREKLVKLEKRYLARMEDLDINIEREKGMLQETLGHPEGIDPDLLEMLRERKQMAVAEVAKLKVEKRKIEDLVKKSRKDLLDFDQHKEEKVLEIRKSERELSLLIEKVEQMSAKEITLDKLDDLIKK